MTQHPPFQIWAFCAVILFLKMHANSVVQLIGRKKANTFRSAEDVRMFGNANTREAEDTDLADRAGRCWRNDLENIPMFLILGLGFVMAGGSTTASAIYFGTFTAGRVLHTIAYLKGLQPWRFLAYQTATTIAAVMGVHLLVRVLT